MVVEFYLDSLNPIESNDTACSRYGYTREEFLTLTAPDITKQVDADAHAAPAHRSQLRDAGQLIFETTHVGKFGKEFPVEINSTVIELGERPTILAVVRDITARKQAEKSLMESKERFENAIRQAPIPMVITDVNQDIVLFNDKFTETFGYALADVSTAEEWWQVAYPDQAYRQWVQASWQTAIEKAQATGSDIEMQEWDLACKDRSVRRVEFKMMPLGEISLIALNDITERKRAEAALRESEAQYRSLFDDSPISLWEQDFSAVKHTIDGLKDQGIRDLDAYLAAHPEAVHDCVARVKLVHVNQATLVLYDAVTKEELLVGLDRYLTEESLAVFREELVAFANGATQFVRENVNRTLTGKTIHCVVSVSIAPGFEETWEKVFVSLIDISERKQAEEALRESEERYRAISELVSDYAFSFRIDPDGVPTVEWITEAFTQITGYTPEEMEQLGWESLRHPDDVAIAQRRVEQHMTGQTTVTEQRLITKGGDVRWVRDYTRPIWDASEQRTIRLVGSTKDITERKQLESETRKADILSMELEKEKELVALKERIISTVSHQFRTPLTVIQTSSDLLIRYYDRLEEARRIQLLEQTKAQIGHMTELIDNVLILGRQQADRAEFNPASLDIEPFCRDIFEQVQFTDTIDHTYEFSSNPPAKPVMMDAHLLRHILTNLLTNASKYSPAQAKIHFEIDHDADRVIFQVRDEGRGIPLEDLRRLFEPFHRGGNVEDIAGTGLGLSISKHYVELHGGDIDLESTLGQGSTFTVSLPMV